MTRSNEITELIADVKEQVRYLQELGVEYLNVELPAAETSAPAIAAPEKFVPAEIEIKTKPRQSASDRPAAGRSRLSALPSLARINTAAADTTPPTEIKNETRDSKIENEKTGSSDVLTALFDDVTAALPPSEETIADIHADIGNCTRCPLWEGRTQIVHSKGDLQSDLMFVGEAPGADEDAQGAPFVGRAGQLLTKIIEGIGFKRDDVFIGNINRCRPPGNRAPTLPEAETCKPFLLREIAIVRPKVIVVMGNTATQNLLNTKIGITRLRGEFQDYFGVKVMPTFHPAYLLRDPHKKREVWEDMKKVRDYLRSQVNSR
jgi:DNA polymerase